MKTTKTPKDIEKVLINFSLSKDVVDKLRQFKIQTGRTYSHIVEAGIRKEVDNKKKNG